MQNQNFLIIKSLGTIKYVRKRKNAIDIKYFDYTVYLIILNPENLIYVSIKKHFQCIFKNYYITWAIKKEKYAYYKKLLSKYILILSLKSYYLFYFINHNLYFSICCLFSIHSEFSS